jgi:hypothetical protein
MLTAWRAAAFRYSGDELRLFAEFQQHLERVMAISSPACAASYPAGCCQQHHRYKGITTGVRA